MSDGPVPIPVSAAPCPFGAMVLCMFRDGLDTLAIAEALGEDEASVANAQEQDRRHAERSRQVRP